MADTEYVDLPTANAIGPADSILIVRNGAAYRYVGDGLGLNTAGPFVSTASGSSGVASTAGMLGRANGGNTFIIGSENFITGGADQGLSLYTYGGNPVRIYTGNAVRVQIEGGGAVRPGADNSQSLGLAAFRWSAIYAGTGAIQTSDARTKQQIGAIPDDWLDAWADVEWVRYRFNDAVAAKGDDARWHVGLVAQQVRDAFAARSLDALAIGLLCYDEWEATPALKAVKELRDDAGEVIREARPRVPARSAGDRWGLRYDECQAIEAAWQRREMTRLAARLAAIEAGAL